MREKAMRVLGIAVVLLAVPATFAQEEHAAKAPPKKKFGSSMPFERLGDDGRLHIAYVEQTESATTIRYRQMFGGAPVESVISAPGDKPSHWVESPPIIEVMHDGTIHVLYTVRVPAAPGADYPIELRLATSSDSGRTWAPHRVVGDPEVRVYRACAAMREDAQGRLVLSWLEGHPGQNAIGVKTAIMRDGNIEYAFVDEMTCECCATELVRTADGAMWLAYRDKDEMNVRDMFLMRMAAGEDRFGPPTRISRDKWVVNGCPETGPRFALTGEDAVWVAWFSGNPRGIYASRATLAAPQFEPREIVQGTDDHVSNVMHPAIATPPDGRLLVIYQCRRDGIDRIEGRVREASGWGEPIELGPKCEYPRIAANGRKAYLVYTAVTDTDKLISVRDLTELEIGRAHV